MKELLFTVKDPAGLHARPAGLLVKEAQRLPDRITVIKGDTAADLKKLLAVMGLGIRHGETVTIRIEGADEEASLRHLEKVLKTSFDA
ncbi:MAG: HPr family phosphocarrier protein [Clostridia bacterium]|nr:HPr family phosphocarrier protein [Clostridia bacterium]